MEAKYFIPLISACISALVSWATASYKLKDDRKTRLASDLEDVLEKATILYQVVTDAEERKNLAVSLSVKVDRVVHSFPCKKRDKNEVAKAIVSFKSEVLQDAESPDRPLLKKDDVRFSNMRAKAEALKNIF